jgi:hypothetical protein
MLAFAGSSIATNMSFLQDTPVSRLNKTELGEFRAFVIKNLDEGADGASAEWGSERPRFKSKLTLRRSVNDGAYLCRQTRIESSARELQASGNYWLCKQGDGEWAFRTPSAKATPATR